MRNLFAKGPAVGADHYMLTDPEDPEEAAERQVRAFFDRFDRKKADGTL